MGQWNKRENPDVNPHVYGQFMTKETRIYDAGMYSLFNKWYQLNNYTAFTIHKN